ncbi:DUF397 domain-containing protein [Actinocorallia aurantiaca]|uniref:DUF397 domain-containing protein n=1 Tax=Actinocorallia aurantiaca TaxID=46204 RepID=A0ABP6HAJ6_9ACTN
MAVQWRKSSYSGTTNDDICVEVACFPSGVGVRDSKNPGLGHLALTRGQFGRLASGLKKQD